MKQTRSEYFCISLVCIVHWTTVIASQRVTEQSTAVIFNASKSTSIMSHFIAQNCKQCLLDATVDRQTRRVTEADVYIRKTLFMKPQSCIPAKIIIVTSSLCFFRSTWCSAHSVQFFLVPGFPDMWLMKSNTASNHHNIWLLKAALHLKLKITSMQLLDCGLKLTRKPDKHMKERSRPNENQCPIDQPIPSFTRLTQWIIEHSAQAESAKRRDTTNSSDGCSGRFLPVCLVGIDALCCFPGCLPSTARLEYQAASHWPTALCLRPIRSPEEFRDTSEVSWYKHGERCHFQPLTHTTHAHFQKATHE